MFYFVRLSLSLPRLCDTKRRWHIFVAATRRPRLNPTTVRMPIRFNPLRDGITTVLLAFQADTGIGSPRCPSVGVRIIVLSGSIKPLTVTRSNGK